MKHFFTLLFVCSLHFTYAQNVKIHGNIKDTDKYSSVILTPSIASKLLDSKIEFHPKKGYFEFNIQVDKPSFYNIYYKKKRTKLYLEPNTNIQISLHNDKKDDHATFYSDLSKENNFFNRNNLVSLSSKNVRSELKEQAKIGASEYIKSLEKIIKREKTAFNDQTLPLGLKKEFIDLYEAEYFNISAILYGSYYPYFAGYKYDSFAVHTPQFSRVFEELDSKKAYVANYYKSYMMKTQFLAFVELGKEKGMDSIETIDLYKKAYEISKSISDRETQSYLYENIIGEWISYYGRPTEIKDEINHYITSIQAQTEKVEAVKERLVHLAKYEAGKPAPVFNFIDNSGNTRNIKEFIGKVIFIDVWASWCNPCIKEIPHSKELFKKYGKNEDIVFLYLSIDDDKEKWEKGLLKHKMYDGIQGIAYPNGFNSAFAKKYSIQSIPTFILIDKSGNFIDTKAPNPSQKEEIHSLLNHVLGL